MTWTVSTSLPAGEDHEGLLALLTAIRVEHRVEGSRLDADLDSPGDAQELASSLEQLFPRATVRVAAPLLVG
jgi:hypothetical protein